MDSANKNIHNGHRDRMRKRFEKNGFEGFANHEIIEMFLFYSCPRVNTNDIAHRLIDAFGNISGVLDASIDDLMKLGKISYSSAVLFKMISQCMPVYYESTMVELCYDNTEKLKNLFRASFMGKADEEFRVACMDGNLHLLNNVVISSGTPSFTPVNLRKLLEVAFSSHAVHVVIGHNHPKGEALATQTDIITTKRIYDLLKSVNINLIDHIIVGESNVFSLFDSAAFSF